MKVLFKKNEYGSDRSQLGEPDSEKSARLLTSNRMAEKRSSSRKRAKECARRNKERQNGTLS